MKRPGFLVLLLCGLLIPAVCLWRVPVKQNGVSHIAAEPIAASETTQVTLETTAPVETEPSERRYLLTLVGDCTFGSTPETTYAGVGFVKTVGEDYRYPFANVRSYFEADDVTFANLEGTLTEVGYPHSTVFNFRGSTEYVKILTESSVEAVTLANNHILDYGKEGYDATIQTLENAGVSYVEPNGSTVVTLPDGTAVGIYASAYGIGQKEDVTAGIQALRTQGADIVIYAAHWGVEYSYRVTPEQEALAHAAIDAGANIVYGSHPHVLAPMELYGGGVIFYSLANFCFGGNSAPRDMDTVLIQQEVIVGRDGTTVLGECTIVPCRVSSIDGYNNYQPTPCAPGSEAYQRVLRKLGQPEGDRSDDGSRSEK